jgi:AcrR family transcriptional regulator
MPSVTRPSGRSATNREAITAKVSDAVGRLLAEGHGFTSIGVQRIAEEAGIARSTFYLYFPDKAAVLIAIAASATADLFAAAGAWAEHGFTDLEMLEGTIVGIVAQQREHSALLAAVAEVAAYDEQVAGFWRARVGAFIERLRERIEEGQQNGTIAAGLEPATTAAWVTWGTERLIAQHVAERPPGEDAGLARGLSRAIWSTLGRAPAGG